VRRPPVIALYVAASLASIACSTRGKPLRAAPASSANAVDHDSLAGRVEIVGTAEMPDVTLLPSDGGHAVALRGPLTKSLQSVDGLGVVIVGRRSGRDVLVERFTVVSANGLPATDGIVALRGDTLVLISADSVVHALTRPSPVLRAHIGSRAWVSGPVDHEPVGYGIIQ
jgi:hypothetical protein